MEKERKGRSILIIALFFGVLSLAIGFAGWSASLNITNTSANVSAGNNDAAFKNKILLDSISCSVVGNAEITSAGSLNTEKNTWSGISATLATSGDSATCSAVISNTSDYTAYVNDIIINDSKISCTGEGQNVDEACSSIKLEVTSGGNTAYIMGNSLVNALNISEYSIASGSTSSFSFTISYDGDAISDTDFIAYMPTIKFNVDTVD